MSTEISSIGETCLRISLARTLAQASAAIAAAALAADVLVVFASVIWRYLLHDPLEWAEEVARALMVTLVFCGAATATARGRHVGVDLLQNRLPRHVRAALAAGIRWVLVAVAVGLLWSSLSLLAESFAQTTPTGLPQAIYVAPVVFGAGIMSIGALEHAVEGPARSVVGSGLAVLAFLLGLLAMPHLFVDFRPPSGALMIGLFALGILAGVPIAFTLGFSALVFFITEPSLPFLFFAQQAAAGVDHFVLLAIPFFLLAGAAMEANGMSTRLVELIVRGMGRFRGGMNLTIVLAMAFFSGISGSKLADVAAVGGVLMPAVRRAKQNPADAAGLLATSAVMAETIPPCVNMIIMGFVANISIGALFLAGIVPAAILAGALCIIGVIYGGRINVAEAYPVLTPARQLAIGAAVGLVMVLMIGKGVVSGIATSTEISAFAVVYALVVGWITFRELTWRAVVKLFIDTATLSGMLLFIIAAATSVSFALTIEMIPQRLADLLISVGQTQGAWLFMALSIVLLVVFGAVLEGAPALIIFGPILVPIAQRLGFDPLHYGSVLIIAMGLGLFAPPMGLGLYTTCVVCGVSMSDVVRPMRKYLLALAVALAVVAALPMITLWLPRAMGY
ncbi:TRAP transporter large permease subunit [Bosea sp. 117]|uniref:TRAP transporter large permease n=1 Tax=Bosea sp. 117 TaxID=1125973 RepID=UPI0006902548|nr:TRAP transporter large permease subunit [Bosea sp. 117]